MLKTETIAETISTKVPLLSHGQIAEWGGIDSRSGQHDLARRLHDLVQRDVLRRWRVVAKPTPPLDAPLWVRRPGDPPVWADANTLEWLLEKRWSVEPRVQTVYSAGPRSRQLYGGRGSDMSNLASVSHDLALGALYLSFLARLPERARDWVHESLRRDTLEHGEKLPDVVLYGADGTPYLAVEMLGVYSSERLAALQLFVCNELKIDLEGW